LPTLPDDSKPAQPTPKGEPSTPDWLERGPAYSAIPTPPSVPVASPPPASPEMETLAQKAPAWCARLAKTGDGTATRHAAQKRAPALRAVSSRGDVEALWTIWSTMHGIASEIGGAVGSRAWSASKLLRVLDDPLILIQVAEAVLVGPPGPRDKARRMLMHAGV